MKRKGKNRNKRKRKEKGGRDTFNLHRFFFFFDVVYSTEPTDSITGTI